MLYSLCKWDSATVFQLEAFPRGTCQRQGGRLTSSGHMLGYKPDHLIRQESGLQIIQEPGQLETKARSSVSRSSYPSASVSHVRITDACLGTLEYSRGRQNFISQCCSSYGRELPTFLGWIRTVRTSLLLWLCILNWCTFLWSCLLAPASVTSEARVFVDFTVGIRCFLLRMGVWKLFKKSLIGEAHYMKY